MSLYYKWVLILLTDPGLKPLFAVTTAQTSLFHCCSVFSSLYQYCTFQKFDISFMDTSIYPLELYIVNLSELLVCWSVMLVSCFRGNSQNSKGPLLFVATSMMNVPQYGENTTGNEDKGEAARRRWSAGLKWGAIRRIILRKYSQSKNTVVWRVWRSLP